MKPQFKAEALKAAESNVKVAKPKAACKFMKYYKLSALERNFEHIGTYSHHDFDCLFQGEAAVTLSGDRVQVVRVFSNATVLNILY